MDDAECFSYDFIYVHTGIVKRNSFFVKIMIKASFRLLEVIKQFWNKGSAVENEINAHHLKPRWNYTVSGDKYNNSM